LEGLDVVEREVILAEAKLKKSEQGRKTDRRNFRRLRHVELC
jgi:hypothetical protein